MAIRITLESFLAVLQRSGLVAKDSLDASLERFKEAGGITKEARPFAEYLLAQKDLTRWQTEKLLQGKHKGFFLGRYRLLDLLGKGGMSSVYLAEHTLMRRRCAIKVLPAKWAKTDTSYLGRFHREAQAVASLDHPNIVRAYDVDHEVDNDTEIHFLVMEYVEGKNLVEVIVERGRLPIREAVEFIRQASLGVGHAHRAGLVHRDIKPGNLLVDLSGVVKILDLGLAKFFSGDEASLTVQHDERVLGTADYLAPEQAVDSHSVDSRADIYSLGCSLYFLLTGHPPFNEGTLAQRLIAHQTREPKALESERSEVPEDLLVIIRKMMAKNPDDRYQTADDAARALGDWLNRADEAPTETPAPIGKVKPTPPKPVSGPDAPRIRSASETSDSHRRKPAVTAKPKSSTVQRKPAASADAVAETGSGVGTLVGDNDLGNFLAQLNSSALETDVKESSLVRDRKSPPSTSIAKSDEPAPKIDLNHEQEAPAGKLKETRPEMPAVPQTPEATHSQEEVPAPLPSPASESDVPSSTRLGRRSAKRSLKLPLIAGGAVLGLVLILVFSGILSNGNDDTPEDPPGDNTTDVDPNVTTANTDDGRPQPAIGEDIQVGPGGHFATISAAIDFVRTNVRSGGTIEQSIVVTAGTYADRIVIDNTGRQSLPRGLRIVCNDAAPAVLNPTGSEPVISLDGAEGITIENFVVEAGGRSAAVHLGGYSLNTQLRRLQVQGVTAVGIEAEGASGISGQRLLLDSIVITAAGTEAIGMKCTAELLDTQDIDIVNCRFLGPMRIGVEFATKTWNVTLRQCIFDQARIAVSITATTPDLQGLTFINNTFHAYQRAIVFQDNPQAGSRGFVFVRNLFIDGTGREIDFEDGFDAEIASRLVSSQRFNWSERAAPEDPTKELDIFSGEGRHGVEVPMVSTAPDDPNFLKPAGPELRQAVTETADGYDYIGAVAP